MFTQLFFLLSSVLLHSATLEKEPDFAQLATQMSNCSTVCTSIQFTPQSSIENNPPSHTFAQLLHQSSIEENLILRLISQTSTENEPAPSHPLIEQGLTHCSQAPYTINTSRKTPGCMRSLSAPISPNK